MKNRIVEFAKTIGIDCIGFSGMEFDEDFVQRLARRRKEGLLSGFEEADELIRTDAKAMLKGASTFISIALPYLTSETLSTVDLDTSRRPELSKSSMGADYHRVMKNKLEIICDFLYNEYGAQTKCFCDNSPFPDREIARKCGIGFYGKNSNIITGKYGSFVFLGGIVTDLLIERDHPAEDSCGNCDLCIKACPVQAIVEPYVVDAKRCLSYVSQKKEKLTSKEMDALGNRVYGCDTCQNACPRNRGKEMSELQEFIPEAWNLKLDAKQLLTMTNKEFKQSFARTSAGWRGKKLLQRNMVIAMGNSGDSDYLQTLQDLRTDDLKEYFDYAINKLKIQVRDEINDTSCCSKND